MAAPIQFPESSESTPSDSKPQIRRRLTGLRITPRSAFADGNAGAIRLHDCADHHPVGNDSAGLRAGRQRHLARLHSGDGGDLLVALVRRRFARYSSSPGSLYTYASMILPPWLAAIAAWSLLLAYVATGSSVIGGFYQYANLTAARHHGPRISRGPARHHRHRHLHVDRVARRKNFRAPDAVDRSCLRCS